MVASNGFVDTCFLCVHPFSPTDEVTVGTLWCWWCDVYGWYTLFGESLFLGEFTGELNPTSLADYNRMTPLSDRGLVWLLGSLLCWRAKERRKVVNRTRPVASLYVGSD